MLRITTLKNCLHHKKINLHVLLQLSRKLSTGVPRQGANKNVSVRSEAKIMGKLFGNRVTGSKKRWYPTNDVGQGRPSVLYSASQMTKPTKHQGQSTTRRMNVLNKLFMKHITDMLATGEVSEKILGRGLQVSNVKITSDFNVINVYWSSGSETVADDADLEQELQRCSGLLRHELSQLCLMGVVPRIHFVRDKKHVNMAQVERLLRGMDFGEDYKAADASDAVKRDFHWKDMKPVELNEEDDASNQCSNAYRVPEMRHDILGLDHRGIMLKIFTKMRKSKQAWEQHEKGASVTKDSSIIDGTENVSKENRPDIERRLASAAAVEEQFNKFLAQRKDRKNTPERKKFRSSGQYIDASVAHPMLEEGDHGLLNDEDDFLHEEEFEKKS